MTSFDPAPSVLDLPLSKMQTLALLPDKVRHRRRVRQRVLDPESPRAAFANPKYGSTSRNFIFRVMATRKVKVTPMSESPVSPPPYQPMLDLEERLASHSLVDGTRTGEGLVDNDENTDEDGSHMTRKVGRSTSTARSTRTSDIAQGSPVPPTSVSDIACGSLVPLTSDSDIPQGSPVPLTSVSDIELHLYHPHVKPETPCQKIYQRACAKLHILPSMSVYEHLPCSQMVLPHCGVGLDEVKAIAIALVHNNSVHTLNISDNRLGSIGTSFITEALRENRSLTDLNLSNNALGSEGTRLVADALLSNTSIVRVNLSGNNIQDKDIVSISEMLKHNRTLRDLNLSHNHVCHIGGALLGQSLAVNNTLRILNVSWNHLRLRGAVSFCRGLSENCGLTRLYLSWNGLAMEGCNELGKALATNTHLAELDVAANRINGAACRRLLAGLRTNTSLRCLRIGTNPITTECAFSILLMLAEDVTGLIELDLTDISVDGGFLDLLQKVQEQRPLAVTHGVPLRHDDVTPGSRPVVLDTDDPMTILFEFMRQKNLRLIDLLHSLDKDNSDTLTRDELRNGLLNIDIPLSSRSMDILMSKLDLNRDGHIDYEELAIGLKEYLRKTAKWKRKSEQPVFSRLQQLREAIRMRIEASQRRGSS